jgi:hypothetical protein
MYRWMQQVHLQSTKNQTQLVDCLHVAPSQEEDRVAGVVVSRHGVVGLVPCPDLNSAAVEDLGLRMFVVDNSVLLYSLLLLFHLFRLDHFPFQRRTRFLRAERPACLGWTFVRRVPLLDVLEDPTWSKRLQIFVRGRPGACRGSAAF